MFDAAIEYVLQNEGALEENIHDVNGITNFGISLRAYRELAFPQATADDIRYLSKPTAIAFYKKYFWIPAYDEIFSQNIANYIFDMSVNMGRAVSHKIAQRSIWAITCDLAGMPDDGILGDNTIHLINVWSNQLLSPMRAERASQYRCLINNNSDLKAFEQGWMNRTYRNDK